MAERQTVTVSIDAGELAGPSQLHGSTLRRDIDEDGALKIGDGFGVLTIAINGHAAVHLKLHEDRNGYVVLDVVDGHQQATLGRFEAELYGLVPPRHGSKGRGRG